MARITEANVAYLNLQDRSADPTDTPTTDYGFLYIKNDGLYIKLDNGNVVSVISSVSGLNDLTNVDIATTPPATGTLLAYDGSNFVSVPVGTDGQLLSADSGETTGLSWVTNISATDDDARIFAILGW